MSRGLYKQPSNSITVCLHHTPLHSLYVVYVAQGQDGSLPELHKPYAMIVNLFSAIHCGYTVESEWTHLYSEIGVWCNSKTSQEAFFWWIMQKHEGQSSYVIVVLHTQMPVVRGNMFANTHLKCEYAVNYVGQIGTYALVFAS